MSNCCNTETNKVPLLALARRYRQKPHLINIGKNIIIDASLVCGAKYGSFETTVYVWRIFFIDNSYIDLPEQESKTINVQQILMALVST